MLIQTPLLLPNLPMLIKKHMEEPHPSLIVNKQMQLAAFLVSGLGCKQKDFQQMLQRSSQIAEDRSLQQLTKPPGISGIIGAPNGILNRLNAL